MYDMYDRTDLGLLTTSPNPFGTWHLKGSDWDIDKLFANFSIQSKQDYWNKTDKGFELKLKYPGVSKEQIKVTVKEEYVVTRIKEDTEFYSKDTFNSYLLPKCCKRKELKASMKDGVLIITVPNKYEDYEVKVD